MDDGHWQRTVLERVVRELSADPDVRGMAVIGSCAYTDAPLDTWSDVDLVVVTADDAVERFASPAWLRFLGEPYAAEQGTLGVCRTLRCYLADGRRVDSMVVGESAFAEDGVRAQIPFAYGARVLFTRTPLLEQAIAEARPSEPGLAPGPGAFDRLADGFRFKAMLAVSKAARDDLLVALHLSLDLVRDCAFLAMMLRDRETGTTHHRDGRDGNRFVDALDATRQPYTRDGILESIRQGVLAFESLAAQWDPGCRASSGPLLAFVERALARADRAGREPV